MSGASSSLRGIAYIVAAMTVLSASDAAAKWLSPHYDAAEIMWVRSMIGLPLAVVILALTRGREGFRTRKLGGHAIRTGLMLIAWGPFIYALRTLPLADAFTIAFCSPLFMTVFGYLLLGERVTRARWIAVGVGFLGVVVVLQPSGTGFGLPALATLFAALMWALSTTFTRRLTVTDSSESMLFFYMLLSTLVLSLGLPTYSLSIDPGHGWIFAVTAISGTVGHWLIAQGFRYGEVSLLAVFEYLALVWALLFGYWIWNDTPNATVLLGAALIIGSGIAIARQEGRRARAGAEDPADAEGVAA